MYRNDEFLVYLVQTGASLTRVFLRHGATKENMLMNSCTFTELTPFSKGFSQAKSIQHGSLTHFFNDDSEKAINLIEIDALRKQRNEPISCHLCTNDTVVDIHDEAPNYRGPHLCDLRTILNETANPRSVQIGRVSLKALVIKQTDQCIYVADNSLTASMKLIPLTYSSFNIQGNFTSKNIIFEDVLLLAKSSCISLRMDEHSNLKHAPKEIFCHFGGSLLDFLAPTSFLKHHSLRIQACLFKCSGKLTQLTCQIDDEWKHLEIKEPKLVNHYTFWSFVNFSVKLDDGTIEDLEVPLDLLKKAVPTEVLSQTKSDIFRRLAPFRINYMVEWHHNYSGRLKVVHFVIVGRH